MCTGGPYHALLHFAVTGAAHHCVQLCGERNVQGSPRLISCAVQVRAVAATGVTYISVGSLTHSVRAMDISLKIKLEV